jgi:hypothetical protein
MSAGPIRDSKDLNIVADNYIGCLTRIKRQARAHEFYDAYRAILDLERDMQEDIANIKNYLISKGGLK